MKIIDNVPNSSDFFPTLCLLRAHAAYFAAVRLSISGQVAEAYMVIRKCIENALYGFYLSKNPDDCQIFASA